MTESGITQRFTSVHIYSKGLNCLRKSDFSAKEVFFDKISTLNFVTRRGKFVLKNAKERLASIFVKPATARKFGNKISFTKAPFIWRKVAPGRRVTRLPELPCASQLFLHFLTKLGEPFTKSWLGWKGDPPCWVTLF